MGMLEKIFHAIWGAIRPADVDAEALLTEKAKGRALDWRNSIVDLLKVLNLDSSIGARRTLAEELGFEGMFNGSASDNQWLHRKVMEKVRRGELS